MLMPALDATHGSPDVKCPPLFTDAILRSRASLHIADLREALPCYRPLEAVRGPMPGAVPMAVALPPGVEYSQWFDDEDHHELPVRALEVAVHA